MVQQTFDCNQKQILFLEKLFFQRFLLPVDRSFHCFVFAFVGWRMQPCFDFAMMTQLAVESHHFAVASRRLSSVDHRAMVDCWRIVVAAAGPNYLTPLRPKM
jgi:hypothetical protein